MTALKRRLLLGALVLGAALAGGWAYWVSLVPATHPDHDHGILNLDAGGRLIVRTRDGKKRNLVGRPGHVLVIHFFSPSAAGAADELSGLFRAQESLKGDPVEFVLIARAPDFGLLDRWLADKKLVPPVPQSLVLDPDGDTTQKLNCKRPLETMIFNPEGKLASQARGTFDWAGEAPARIAEARAGATIE